MVFVKLAPRRFGGIALTRYDVEGGRIVADFGLANVVFAARNSCYHVAAVECRDIAKDGNFR